MKKIFNLIVWISSLSILLLSCTNDETENDKKPGNDDNNMVTVSLGAAGEILEVEETPLSKAGEAADVYGVQIFSSPKDEDNYKPYGYGLFRDKSKMQVELFKDRKYKFEMTLFPDNGINGHIRLIEGSMTRLTTTDSIVYTENDSLEVNRSPYWHDYFTDNNRYYGKTTDYIPTENTRVDIDLKRVVAGLTFHIKGLTDKSLLTIDCDSICIRVEGDGTTKEITVNKLICLLGEEKDYDKYYYTDKWFENPIEDMELEFRWTNDEHTEYFTQTVTLKRKMNYTFKITIPETFLVSNGITVTEEEAIWDNDIHVDNIYFGDLIIKNAADLEAIRGSQYTKITGDCIISDVEISNSPFYNIQNIGGNFILNNVIAHDSIFFYLNSVGNDFKILQTKDMAEDMRVVDLGCLVNLHKIGGNFEISSNFSNSFSNVRSINAYSLSRVGGDITFKNLSALKNYCSLKTVLQNHKGQFITSGNAYNPTKEQILAGECSIE